MALLKCVGNYWPNDMAQWPWATEQPLSDGAGIYILEQGLWKKKCYIRSQRDEIMKQMAICGQ